MPRVKFITTGHSHLVGNFSAGDAYNGAEAVCRHFVEDAHAAVWDEVKAEEPVVQTPGPVSAPAPARPARAPRAPRTGQPASASSTPAPAPVAEAEPEAPETGDIPEADSAPAPDAQIGN